ncbi:MAG TPA: tRNA epoxyqueuosine(34) reductase QueG [Bacteroidota bacterium]|nr:tRNA epoxyqueuosine(34) reductase QueG [Bacteroidota bacterium]
MDDLTGRIKKAALDTGFSKVGIARIEHLSGESAHLTEWLGRGFHGTMGWMARNMEKRQDPRRILPGARSMVCVALNYHTDAKHSDKPESGKISRYAWGDDYHEIVSKKLEELARRIVQLAPGSRSKAYVDTGPVMEKAWAARAGLGWQGKHTNLITKDFGSWVFLGEIITDLDLSPDEPIADFCGTCTACIEACPTDAIVQPYVVDSNKCISYLTIEHKGEIPSELHPQLKQWVYGCDICQDVCPWNSFQQSTNIGAFAPREKNVAPKLADLVEMSTEEFSSRFKKSPIKRTKLSGIVRNARAVLKGSRKE